MNWTRDFATDVAHRDIVSPIGGQLAQLGGAIDAPLTGTQSIPIAEGAGTLQAFNCKAGEIAQWDSSGGLTCGAAPITQTQAAQIASDVHSIETAVSLITALVCAWLFVRCVRGLLWALVNHDKTFRDIWRIRP